MPRAQSAITPPSAGSNLAAKRHRIIELNDQLRSSFKGGRVQMTRGVYDLDERLRGRALAVMAKYNKVAEDSEHDCGVFIFAGYWFEWRIEYRAKESCKKDNQSNQMDQRQHPDQAMLVLRMYLKLYIYQAPHKYQVYGKYK